MSRFWFAFTVSVVSLGAHADILVYPHLVDPRAHPDYARRVVKPPSWETFENQTQFVCLRGFGQKDGALVDYAPELERYTKTLDLGRVIWPQYDLVFAKNISEFADEIKRRNLWLFDPWGYVPGTDVGPGGSWNEFRVPEGTLRTLEEKLGERWLGMDVGEQDGRYIGGYAPQVFPVSGDRMEQYLNFQRHFQRMGDDLGQRLAALVSLNFGHYLLKEGTYTVIGAETAQALPSSQVFYAFNRGAGKQYGLLWFGNASIFNRWGWKTYGYEGKDNSPTKGTSLNLLKRLLYSQILYNSAFVGFENMWLDGEHLTPIGRIQQSAQQWVRAHGPVGVMHTPVALLLDFQAGWTFPRHLYTGDTFRVWGNLPYDEGDHFTDGVLDLIYPGYADASYYHDERGFISPTPYGDIADALLGDAALWTLKEYPLLIAAGRLTPSEELRDKLTAYVQSGGHLVLTEGNRDALKLDTGNPGAGRFTIIPGTSGVEADGSVLPPIKSLVDSPLARPYKLTTAAHDALDAALREEMLFDAGPDLTLITCRKAPGQYTLGVLNNTLAPLPLKITSRCGAISALTESVLDTSERGAVGEFPAGFEATPPAENTPDQLAPAAIRIFDVTVQENGVHEIPASTPPPAPKGRALPLGNPTSIKEAILRRPTFFEHFDGVLVDARYLELRETDALAREAAWLRRQAVRIYVDLRPLLNLYPDLRLTNNNTILYPESMARIDQLLDKMNKLGASDLLLCLHRQPEVGYTIEQTRASFAESLKRIATEAATRKITVLLAQTDKFAAGIEATAAFVRDAQMGNLKLAPSIALLVKQGFTPGTLAADTQALAGLWLASAPGSDANGKLYTTGLPVTSNEQCVQWLDAFKERPIAFDASYPDTDAEYRDVRSLEATSAP